MTTKHLTWRDGTDDNGKPIALGEDAVGMCCLSLYAVGKASGGFWVKARYAYRDDPIRRDEVFATIEDAQAAAEAAYDRLLMTKFWDVLLCHDCVIANKLERKHRPECETVPRAAALFGCPANVSAIPWLIEQGFLVENGDGYGLTEKANRLLYEYDV